MIKFDIDNNVKESNKTLISILPKITESHNQINHFFVKDTYKTNVNKKSFQFCLKPNQNFYKKLCISHKEHFCKFSFICTTIYVY